MSKKSKLARLAAYRSGVNLNTALGDSLSNYKHLRSISKVFEDREDYKYCISPITKSALNLDAKIMIVLNDWCNVECVDESEIPELEKLGYGDKSCDTNNKLDELLNKHLNLSRKDIYITNSFPYLKPGKRDSEINDKIMSWSISKFLIPQIQIIKPKFIICMGYNCKQVRKILCNTKRLSITKHIKLNDDIDTISYSKTKSLIFCQYHPNVRPCTATPQKVNQNWIKMVKIIKIEEGKL